MTLLSLSVLITKCLPHFVKFFGESLRSTEWRIPILIQCLFGGWMRNGARFECPGIEDRSVP